MAQQPISYTFLLKGKLYHMMILYASIEKRKDNPPTQEVLETITSFEKDQEVPANRYTQWVQEIKS